MVEDIGVAGIHTNEVRKDEIVCQQCGESFQAVGHHWSRSSCSYPQITQYQMEVMVGVLLGDGTIAEHGDKYVFQCEMVSGRFLRWLYDHLGWLSSSLLITDTAKESAEKNRRYDSNPEAQQEDYRDKYIYRTISHEGISPLRDWYSSGQKKYPDDLALTPLIAKLWYVTDGSLQWKRSGGRPSAQIRCRNESDRPEYIESLFSEVGFDVTYYEKNGTVHFGVYETPRFLDWIGDPLPNFEYKWEIDSYSQYVQKKSVLFNTTRPYV